MRNAEQQAADQKLLDAIEEIIRVDNLFDPGVILLDFVVTMEGQDINDLMNNHFASAYKGGYCRHSTAVGLLIGHLIRLLK